MVNISNKYKLLQDRCPTSLKQILSGELLQQRAAISCSCIANTHLQNEEIHNVSNHYSYLQYQCLQTG